MSEMANAAFDFSLDDLRRDVLSACLTRPGSPDDSEILDPYAFISQPAISRRIGRWVGHQLPMDVDRLVGAGTSSLGLALASGLEVGLPVAFLGEGGLLGEVFPRDRVAVIADITRTGSTVAETIAAVVEVGAEITLVFVICDRGFGALDRLSPIADHLLVLIDDLSINGGLPT